MLPWTELLQRRRWTTTGEEDNPLQQKVPHLLSLQQRAPPDTGQSTIKAAPAKL